MPEKEVTNGVVSDSQIGPILGRLPFSFGQSVKQQTRIITLNDGQHLDSTLYRLEKGVFEHCKNIIDFIFINFFVIGWIVEFRLGPSLLGKQISIFANHPTSIEDEFQRHKYHKVEWQYGGEAKALERTCVDDTAMFAQLVIKRAGSIHYYFIQEDR